MLEHAAQRNCGCSILESVQGQTGGVFEQPGVVGGIDDV